MRNQSRSRLSGLAPACLPFLILLAGLGTAAEPEATPKPLDAEQAIQLAAERAPNPAPATFLLTIKASGKDDGIVFLNTEADYRSPRSVAIELLPDVAKQLGKRLGGKPGTVLVGKTVYLIGEVRQVPIYINDASNQRRAKSGLDPLPAYYQTHVFIRNADQLQVVADQ